MTGQEAESTRQFDATDTVRREIEDVEDVNEATKRVNSILNGLRGVDGTADVQIVIADLSDGNQPANDDSEDENWLYDGECPNCGDALCIERLGDSDICYDCGTEVDADA